MFLQVSNNQVFHPFIIFINTVEPCYNEVGYNKNPYNKVILLAPALYISVFF